MLNCVHTVIALNMDEGVLLSGPDLLLVNHAGEAEKLEATDAQVEEFVTKLRELDAIVERIVGRSHATERAKLLASLK